VVAGKAEMLRPSTPELSPAMTVHAQKLLMPGEFASLIEIAVTLPDLWFRRRTESNAWPSAM
jgi:hypothetical protein